MLNGRLAPKIRLILALFMITALLCATVIPGIASEGGSSPESVDETPDQAVDDTAPDTLDKAPAEPAENALLDLAEAALLDPANEAPAEITGADPLKPAAEAPLQSADEALVEPADTLPVIPASEDSDVRSLAHEKTIAYAGNGLYDITLNVTGQIGSETQPIPLDVLIILDASKSMEQTAGDKVEKWEVANSAIQTMTSSLNSNVNLNVRYSLITYNGRVNTQLQWQDATLVSDWSGTIPTITKNLQQGTNYEAGLIIGIDQLNKARSSALKATLFISDGNPTAYYDANGRTVFDGGDYTPAANAAYKKADLMTNTDFFYTIGVGTSKNINVNILTQLSKQVDIACAGKCTVNTNNAPFMANTLSDLNKVFEQIESKLTEYKCSNVSITDSLSQWAELTEKSGTPVSSITGNYTIKITNASGIEQTVPEGTTVTYDSSTKQVKLTLPASYELQSGYTYAITFRVRPTDAAFQDYAANGAYPDIGDTGTGASSVGKAGYDSNTEALLRYTYKDSAKTESYAVPVLQLNGAVSVTKTAEGLPTESADNGPVSIL